MREKGTMRWRTIYGKEWQEYRAGRHHEKWNIVQGRSSNDYEDHERKTVMYRRLTTNWRDGTDAEMGYEKNVRKTE